mmetsp:Transcript_52205/g.122132  ORF Transcript_52205/g.122132 Transcript_52205/m.122132 type:complete len:389 (+) Transcript_52205:94-1260(+)
MRRVELGHASFPLRAFGSAASPLAYGPMGFSGLPAEKGLAVDAARRVSEVFDGLHAHADRGTLALEPAPLGPPGPGNEASQGAWSPWDRFRPHWQEGADPVVAASGPQQRQPSFIDLVPETDPVMSVALRQKLPGSEVFVPPDAVADEISSLDQEIEKIRKQMTELQAVARKNGMPTHDEESHIVALTLFEFVDGSSLGIVLHNGTVETVMHPVAARAGWMVGDAILRINGVPVKHPEMPGESIDCSYQLESAIAEHYATRRPIIVDVLRKRSAQPQVVQASRGHSSVQPRAGPPAMEPTGPASFEGFRSLGPPVAHPYGHPGGPRQDGRRRNVTRGMPMRYGYGSIAPEVVMHQDGVGTNLGWNAFLQPRDKAPAEQVLEVVQSAFG